MAIQESVNRILGSVAAGAVGLAKAGESSLVKQEQGQLAKAQYSEAKASEKELNLQVEGEKKALEEANKAVEILQNKRPGGKGNTKKAIAEKLGVAMSDKQAAEKSLSVLSDKIEAQRAMMERARLIMKRTGVGGNE